MMDIDTEDGPSDSTSGSCDTIPSTSTLREDGRVAPEKTLTIKMNISTKAKGRNPNF